MCVGWCAMQRDVEHTERPQWVVGCATLSPSAPEIGNTRPAGRVLPSLCFYSNCTMWLCTMWLCTPTKIFFFKSKELKKGGSSSATNFRGISWFETFAVIWILYIFFWVFPRRQIVVGRRFGTLYKFHLQRLGVNCTPSLWRWNWYRVPKRRPATIWRRGNTQKKIYKEDSVQ